jgi:hypothetical protein
MAGRSTGDPSTASRFMAGRSTGDRSTASRFMAGRSTGDPSTAGRSTAGRNPAAGHTAADRPCDSHSTYVFTLSSTAGGCFVRHDAYCARLAFAS